MNLFSSTINGIYQSAAGVALTGQIHYDPIALNPNGTYIVGTPRVSITLTNGGWTNTLSVGNYQVSFSATRDKFLIAVPNDSATYNINTLATTSPTYPQPSLLIFQGRNEKGTAGGYAPLDANSKVPTNNLPDSIGSGAGITALTGDVIATGPGNVASTIAPNTVDATKLNDTDRFDAGQFNGDSGTQEIKIQPGVANASGGSITFSWADAQPTVLETTNSVDLTVTIADVPTLTGRTKSWRLRLFSPDGTKTLTFAGAPLVLGSGTFINPPPVGINDYLFERFGGTNYYHVLRPGVSATKRFLGRTSAGAGDVQDFDIDTAFGWPDPSVLGDTWWYDGTNWRHRGIGNEGEFYQVINGLPVWGTSPSSTGYDFLVTGTSTNATPLNLYTLTIAENTTVALRSRVTGGGSTNSSSVSVEALYRRNTGGSTSLIDTNDDRKLPDAPESSAFWTISGNDAILQVAGVTNNFYNWRAVGWKDIVFNGTNTYVPFTSGYNGVNTWWDASTVPTGLTDGKQGTLAFWWDQGNTDGIEQTLFKMGSGANNRLLLRRTTTNTLQLICYDSATAQVLNVVGSATLNAATGWQHYFVTFDLADTNKRFWFVNGTNDTAVSWNTYTDATIDYQPASSPRYSLGANFGGNVYANGGFSDFVFNDSYFTPETPIGYFITSGVRPTSIGTDGSTPFGSAPVLYLSGGGGGNNWTNTASAYQFTLHGTLSEPSPP